MNRNVTHLLAPSDVAGAGHGGDQTKLGMVEHHELSVGSEAVVALVCQAGAVLRSVLGPPWYVNSPVRDVTRVVDPELRGSVSCVRCVLAVPVVVCLPALRVKLIWVRSGPVIEGHCGAGLDVNLGKETLAGSGDLRLQHLHLLTLVRVWNCRI